MNFLKQPITLSTNPTVCYFGASERIEKMKFILDKLVGYGCIVGGTFEVHPNGITFANDLQFFNQKKNVMFYEKMGYSDFFVNCEIAKICQNCVNSSTSSLLIMVHSYLIDHFNRQFLSINLIYGFLLLE